jgi:hypothetical protein
MISAHSFLDVPAQSVPVVALGKDVFRKALGAITAVFLLYHLKNQFVHLAKNIAQAPCRDKFQFFILLISVRQVYNLCIQSLL